MKGHLPASEGGRVPIGAEGYQHRVSFGWFWLERSVPGSATIWLCTRELPGIM